MNIDARQLLADCKFYESYSRFDETLSRYETWEESVDRVMTMHKEYYKDKIGTDSILIDYINFATNAYKKKLFLGSQRALQYGGEQLLKHQVRLYNCVSGHCDRPSFFGEYFYILLCGAGAGFSVQKHHVGKLPQVILRNKQPKVYVVEDSIEGWASSIDVLLSSYFEDGGKYPEYKGHRIYFDLSKIRPKGSLISGGFKAPGSDPLRLALDRVEHILQGIVLHSKKAMLRPIQVYDICMHIADAVLAGGVRRSATICLFSPDDEEMINAKTGNWFVENPQRGRSNNSAVVVRDKIDKKTYESIMSKIKEFGEPGFVFVDSSEHTVNPCVPGNTRILTDKGYFPIIDLIGETVNVWNGDEFKPVIPKKTGESETVLVSLSDGTSLECTPYHRFVIEGKFIEARDLLEGMKLEKFSMPVVKEGKDYNIDPYSQGFYSGNGNTGLTYSWLYSTKYGVIDRLVGSFKDGAVENRKIWYHGPMLSKVWVPIDANLKFKLNWLAGILDSDGTVLKNPNSASVQICSINLEFLKEIRLMLTTMGCQAKISLSRPEGNYDLPGGQYHCQTTYRLLINSTDVSNLCDLGLNCSRLVIEKNSPQRDARRFVTVTSVESYGETQSVYCFSEPETGRGTFEGIVTGQCVEIGMYPKYEGESGWQMCNLCEINGGECSTEEIFYEACKAAAILGTLQAGYTDFKFLSDVTRKITEREALLGVSITGWMSNPKILFDERIQRKGAKIVLETNKEIAKLIGINPAARTTCVKPAGNSSVLLKTASGIHPEHSPRYFRNVQLNKDTEVADIIKKTNPYMVEESVWSAAGTDFVVSFPITTNSGSLYKQDLMGIKHLEYVKKVQQNWVEYGTDADLCVDKSLRHNVSNTIIVDDWDSVIDYVWKNKKYFAGISFIPASGDKIYDQAPFTEVLTPRKLFSTYGIGSLFASGLIVDALKAFNNLWSACASARGLGEKTDGNDSATLLKRDWIRRFENFADNYFEGDLTKTEYCLKDVHLLHKWEKINQFLKPIDWVTDLHEKKFVDVDTMGAIACSGGACELVRL